MLVMVEDFLWVGLDAPLRDDEAEQHAPRGLKNTFIRAEFDVLGP
jgi:hypothetical protein